MNVGDIIRITGQESGHEFEIGNTARITKIASKHVVVAERLDGSDYWYISPNDFTVEIPVEEINKDLERKPDPMLHLSAHDVDEIVIKQTVTDKTSWSTITIGNLEICVWSTGYAEKKAPTVVLDGGQPYMHKFKEGS